MNRFTSRVMSEMYALTFVTMVIASEVAGSIRYVSGWVKYFYQTQPKEK